MEQQLFTWENWDDIDTLAVMYYNVMLKVAIGPFKPGAQLESVYLDYDKSIIQVWKDNKSIWEGALRLVVEEKQS